MCFLFSDVDPFIGSQMELIASTQALTITDQLLTPKINRSLFKALHFQSNITKIDLSNSFIEDEGVKNLAQALPTITQLIHLNLSGNLITSAGIKYLSSIFDNPMADCLSELSALNLSFNPLRNQSMAALEKFCQHLKQLTTLNLASTELSDLYDFDLKFFSLNDIDLSFNEFTTTGLHKAIAKLNSCKLGKFKLSYSFQSLDRDILNENGTADAFVQMLNTGNCANLEEIYLCGMNINDINAWQIIQSTKRSKKLQTISFRENAMLSKITFKLLLDNLSIRNLYLEGCRMLLNDLTESDAEGLNGSPDHCENVIVSLDAEPTESTIFNGLKQFWSSYTQFAGKVFSRGRNVCLTMKPGSVDQSWTYHQ